MKNAKTIFSFLNGNINRLIIDDWQRGYVWSRKNWNKFLETIESQEKINFVGSIIYYYIEDESSVVIVDGQQRLTTFTITLAVIRDILCKKANNDDKKSQQAIAVIERVLHDELLEHTKLIFNKSTENKESYESIVFKKDKTNKDTNIIKAYNFIYKHFSDYSVEELCETYEKIRKLSICEEICDNEDEVEQIFSNQSLGVQLKPNDQINAALINMVKNSALTSDEKREKRNIMNLLSSKIEKDVSFYSRFYYNKTNKWYKAGQILQPMLEMLNENNDIQFVDEIISFHKQETDYNNTHTFKHPALLVLNNDLLKYEITKTKDIIYTTFRNAVIRTIITTIGSIHEEALINVVKQLVENNVDTLEENRIKELINDLIITNKINKKEIFVIDDDTFKNALLTKDLYKAKNNICVYLLELLNSKLNKGYEEITIKDTTIDHIQPQKDSSIYRHTIGNLTLLCRKANSSKNDQPIFDQIHKSTLPINKYYSEKLIDKTYWSDDDILNNSKEIGNMLVDLI